MLAKSVKYRPTAGFLPPVEVRGSVKPDVHLSGTLAGEAFRRRQEQRGQNAQSV